MFKDAQKRVDDWVAPFEVPYWSPLSNLARMTEEVGEVARLLNDMHGDKPKKAQETEQDLGMELSDVLFSIICLANSHNIDLDESFEKMMTKLETRDADRFTKKAL